MGAMYFIECIDKTKGPIRSIYRRLLRFLFSCEYGRGCKFGKGVQLIHNGLGCVIAAKEIGDNVQIYQNVTLGSGKGTYPNQFPVIERDCRIYSGAVVIGNIRVGHGSIVGANAVVINDVPPCVVVGGGTCAYH